MVWEKISLNQGSSIDWLRCVCVAGLINKRVPSQGPGVTSFLTDRWQHQYKITHARKVSGDGRGNTISRVRKLVYPSLLAQVSPPEKPI